MRSTSRILTRVAHLTLVWILGVRVLAAQAQPAPPVAPAPGEAALRRVQAAMDGTDLRLFQVRRVRGFFQGLGRGGEWVGAIESLVQRGARSGAQFAFALDLLGFENVALSAAQLAHRQRVYQGQAGFLFRYQGFRVFDAAHAAANYTVQAVGPAMRAGRGCIRLAVVSRTVDRPSWLLDVDLATDYPLYSAEFTPRGELVAELEVLRADFGAAAMIPPGDTWAWRPRSAVVETQSIDLALAQMAPTALIEPVVGAVGDGYAFERARVITDPLSGGRSLSLVYTDGVDCVFVNQHAQPPLPDNGHVAKVFTDAGITQCLFQVKGTEFLIVGRHSGVRATARLLHAQAVSTL